MCFHHYKVLVCDKHGGEGLPTVMEEMETPFLVCRLENGRTLNTLRSQTLQSSTNEIAFLLFLSFPSQCGPIV